MLVAPTGQGERETPRRAAAESGLPGAAETPNPRQAGLAQECRLTGGRQTPGGGGTRGWPDLRRGTVSPELSLAPGQGAGEAPADLLALQRRRSGVQQPKREDEISTINEERSLWQKQPGEVARAEEETPFWVTERNQWLIQDVGLRSFTKGESSADK